MTTLKIDTITLPAYWASALVNGDYSGIDDAERAHCETVENELANDGWQIVDVCRDDDGEAYPKADCSGGSVLDYVIHKAA